MYSVIIPLYNKAAYIGKAIRSVLVQRNTALELIIVDDGSTDRSVRIVKQFADRRIRLIRQENAGVSTARNRGVKEATYEHIAFLDADDWWEPTYLDEMQKLIRAYPDAGLWAAKYYKVKNGQKTEARIGLNADFKQGYVNYFRVYANTMWMPLYPSSVIINKTIFNELNGFKPELKLGEDFDLWVRIALEHKIAYLNTPLVNYNQDVDLKNRAVGSMKIYRPEHHFIFQLGYLNEAEMKNADLKNLLDRLRLQSLFRYRLKGKYKLQTNEIVAKIDFRSQSLSWRLKYKLPLWTIRLYWYNRVLLSKIKKHIEKIG